VLRLALRGLIDQHHHFSLVQRLVGLGYELPEGVEAILFPRQCSHNPAGKIGAEFCPLDVQPWGNPPRCTVGVTTHIQDKRVCPFNRIKHDVNIFQFQPVKISVANIPGLYLDDITSAPGLTELP